jgi:Fe-Mn family superoxide dismutase
MIELPKLPWAEDSLEPYISKETIKFHYHKHHKAYVDNLNKLIKGTEFEDMKLEQIIAKAGSGPIFNNAAQVWNHTFYWKSMENESQNLGEVGDLIKKEFKTIAAFQKEFGEKGKKLFGSGWVWLTHERGKVFIETTHNANGPKHTPLLVCDVWEHAYYLDTQNERPKYIENFFHVANWDFANENLE